MLSCLVALTACAAVAQSNDQATPNAEQVGALTAREMALPVPTTAPTTIQTFAVSAPVDSFVAVTMKIAEALGVMPAPLGAQSMVAALDHRNRTDSAFQVAGVARPYEPFRMQRATRTLFTVESTSRALSYRPLPDSAFVPPLSL